MSTVAETNSSTRHLKVALAGKPNCGKSTLFNALTGLNQKTGNFPGVTVDKKTGSARLKKNGKTIEAEYIDLPGTYSLYPKSIDEEVACEVLSDPDNPDHPDLVIIVADATNLKRCLFIATQIIDLGMPSILALNMIDELKKSGQQIDTQKLSERLGIPVVEVSAREGTGIEALEQLIVKDLEPSSVHTIGLSEIESDAINALRASGKNFPLYRLLHYAQRVMRKGGDEEAKKILAAQKFNSIRAQSEESMLRYAFIGELVRACSGISPGSSEMTRKIDRVLTHKFWGYIFFIVILLLIFQSIFSLATYPMDWIEQGFSALGTWCVQTLPQGELTDLLVNGLLAGLSGVLVFIPQIALLFMFIAILEDTGYMARVSFIMDKLMRRFGLNGRSVIPLIGGMACAVPAIMSTRTITSWKERLITIFITPLMSCSARLPVYTLLVALTIPDKPFLGIFTYQGLAMMALYVLGFFTALISALVLKWLVKAREKSFFIMELPVYRMPQWKTVFLTIYEKVKVFLFDAGKVIIAISIVLWVLVSHAPGDSFRQVERKYATSSLPEEEKQAHIASEKLETSYAGRLGKTIEPVIRPLGYDWKIGISLITSFAAREVFVGTMATIYGAGSENDMRPIRERMRSQTDPRTGQKVYTAATGFSLLIFYAFALQCMSTIAVVRRETKGWKWPVIQFLYMGGLAYFASFVTYQLLK
ncbi:MAG: ferrous iron transport protein B [Bacteroidetes bacterium]|nr:MAG: ferrous iron transport protein B [Bacteroidota bacterium]